MFYSILSAIAICLCTIPVIWGGIAGRIRVKQNLYARENQEAILAAAARWRLANTQARSEWDMHRSGVQARKSLNYPEPIVAAIDMT
jgi:hypothetical protein